MTPPDVKSKFEDNDVWTQASLIGYGQLRQYEDMERDENYFRALGAKVS